MLSRAEARAELAQDLHGAVGRGELEVRFQPIVDLSDAKIRNVEALVRWWHPSRGLIAPGEFIALAEETGMIEEVGRFVLDEACRTAAGWPATINVSVNVSAAQFREHCFAGDIQAALRRHALAPARLVLEVTESVVVEPDPQTLANLHELRRAGICLALDDFGTGYSALSYLAQFPVDLLKLDRSFLAGLDERPAQVCLVAGIVGLGHSLGMKVVAEGIEHRTQLARVRDLGVDLGQGYLLGTPMSADALAARLATTTPSVQERTLRLIS